MEFFARNEVEFFIVFVYAVICAAVVGRIREDLKSSLKEDPGPRRGWGHLNGLNPFLAGFLVPTACMVLFFIVLSLDVRPICEVTEFRVGTYRVLLIPQQILLAGYFLNGRVNSLTARVFRKWTRQRPMP